MNCQFCGKGFSKGESLDLGLGVMLYGEGEPTCDCYETMDCNTCGASFFVNERMDHECPLVTCEICGSEHLEYLHCEVCE